VIPSEVLFKNKLFFDAYRLYEKNEIDWLMFGHFRDIDRGLKQ